MPHGRILEYVSKAKPCEAVSTLRRLSASADEASMTARFSLGPCTHKSRLVSSGWSLSALPPKADIRQRIEHVCFVPEAVVRPHSLADRNGG
jgi:hypothetical protein